MHKMRPPTDPCKVFQHPLSALDSALAVIARLVARPLICCEVPIWLYLLVGAAVLGTLAYFGQAWPSVTDMLLGG